MTPSEFLALVEKMREHQRAWFKHRQQADLNASKILERSVDKAIAEIKGRRVAMLPGLDSAPDATPAETHD